MEPVTASQKLNNCYVTGTEAMATKDNYSALASAVGPFYTLGDVASWLNSTTVEIEKRVWQRSLLGCSTREQLLLLPVSQFTSGGSAHEGLKQVLDTLATGTADPWTWGLWLTSQVPGQLDGMSGMEWLANRRNLGTLLRLAATDASSWSR
jgi:hypothetical protein